MNAAVDFVRFPSSRTEKKKVFFDWADELTLSDQQEILTLMNMILERGDSIGFPQPLAWDEGMSLMMGLSESIKNREKFLLLVKDRITNATIGHLMLTPSSLPNCRHAAEISQVFVPLVS